MKRLFVTVSCLRGKRRVVGNISAGTMMAGAERV